MSTQPYYLLSSRQDGSYLAARPGSSEAGDNPVRYLLVFTADYDALSYLNTHAPQVAERFSVEAVMPSQLSPVMQRWSFEGMAVVEEPRAPQVQFYRRS